MALLAARRHWIYRYAAFLEVTWSAVVSLQLARLETSQTSFETDKATWL